MSNGRPGVHPAADVRAGASYSPVPADRPVPLHEREVGRPRFRPPRVHRRSRWRRRPDSATRPQTDQPYAPCRRSFHPGLRDAVPLPPPDQPGAGDTQPCLRSRAENQDWHAVLDDAAGGGRTSRAARRNPHPSRARGRRADQDRRHDRTVSKLHWPSGGRGGAVRGGPRLDQRLDGHHAGGATRRCAPDETVTSAGVDRVDGRPLAESAEVPA